MTIKLRQENERAVPIGLAVPPRWFKEEGEAETAQEQARISEPCDGCNWPAVCVRDGTCWEAVREAREQARLEKRAERPPREKEEKVEGLDALERMDSGEPQSPNGATATLEATCKADGCDAPPVSARGRYAGLCAEHKLKAIEEGKRNGSFRRASRARRAATPEPPPTEQSEGWDDLRALAGKLRAAVDPLSEAQSRRLADYLEAQGLCDRRSPE